jgi:hypothetical protein
VAMSEQEDVVRELRAAGVLAGIRWAYLAACARTLADYDEADGHDATWFGTTRHTYYRDRLDRVFACERYAVVDEGAGGEDVDLVFERLSQEEIDTFPTVATGAVIRRGLSGSPGWVFNGHRFLLAATPFGDVARLPWPRKSPVKQRVAAQHTPEPAASLFDEFDDDEVGSLRALALTGTDDLDLSTFVVAHSLHPITGERELVFGRAKLNAGGGEAWWWREDLLRDGSVGGGARTEVGPSMPPSDDEPDAPVTLRRTASQSAAGRVGREQ